MPAAQRKKTIVRVKKKPTTPRVAGVLMSYKVRDGIDAEDVAPLVKKVWGTIQNAVRELDHQRNTAKNAAETGAAIQKKLLGLFQELNVTEVTVSGDESFDLKAKLTEGTSMSIDEQGLRERLGDEVVDRMCRKVLDDVLIQAAIANGEVDMGDIAACTNEEPRTPYIKVTTRRAR